MDKYRTLDTGEVIREGDEVDISTGWNDQPHWVLATCIGDFAPDPSCPAHRVYRRKVLMCEKCKKHPRYVYNGREYKLCAKCGLNNLIEFINYQAE